MLYGFLLTLFVLLCFFMIALILIQKSKGSLGIGSLGGSAQMLFGATGGQDLFQKITWICGGLFMAGSLVLALMKSTSLHTSRYLSSKPKVVVQQELPMTEPSLASEPQIPTSEAQ
jgi:preprotein translocase subunit SecG